VEVDDATQAAQVVDVHLAGNPVRSWMNGTACSGQAQPIFSIGIPSG
jgi:hypothetical protein